MAALTHHHAAPVEHDVRSLGAVVVSGRRRSSRCSSARPASSARSSTSPAGRSSGASGVSTRTGSPTSRARGAAGTRRAPRPPRRSCTPAGSPRPANTCCPARPSSARLNANLSIRTACGDLVAMIRAYSSPASSSSSWATTSLTAPHASACSAEYSRARKKISRARFCPTCRASSAEPYPPSNEPTLASVCMNRACSRLAIAEVRDDVQRVPAAGRPAVDQRDDDLRHRPDQPLHLEDVQAPGARRVDVVGGLALGVAGSRRGRGCAGRRPSRTPRRRPWGWGRCR